MKGRSQSPDLRSASPGAASPSYYTYLKPGALAQLRYSRITARSKKLSAQTLHALIQFDMCSDSSSSRSHVPDLTSNGVPCFNFRFAKYPRCLQRKKLVAATPFFCETQS